MTKKENDIINKERIVLSLQDMIKIPSHDDCSGMTKYVEKAVKDIGFNPEVDSEGNVVVRIGSGKAFLLNAHMDTVDIKGYPEAHSGEIKDEKIYGRGSTDDKSGVAAMIEIMHALKKKPIKNQVIFAFTVWEESHADKVDGAIKVSKEVDATHGIVLETSVYEDYQFSIDIGCKGRFVYSIDVIGKATHSGRPEEGINSIYLASKLIEKLKGFKTNSIELQGIKIESKLNVTQIEAKDGTNIIPGKCTLTVDYRAIPGDKENEIFDRIKTICKEVLGDSFELKNFHKKSSYIEDDKQYLELCTEAINASGFKTKTGFSSGWMDAQLFSKEGVKMFNIGPGTHGQPHKTPEYCWIPGLLKGTEAILNIIRKWDET